MFWSILLLVLGILAAFGSLGMFQESSKPELAEKKKENRQTAAVGVVFAIVFIVWGIMVWPSAKIPTPKQAVANTQTGVSNLKPGPDKVSVKGGLGDTFNVIKSVYGDPNRVTKEMNQGFGMFNFQSDKVDVDFVQSRADHVTYASVDLTMEQAKELAKQLMPPDAQLVKQYEQDSQQFYVYKSQQLSTLFDQSWFENKDSDVQSGYFDISFLIDRGKVISVDSFIGDNP